MMLALAPAATPRSATPEWRRSLLALGLVTALILATFHHDLFHLVSIWWTSTTFGHCLFIGPVIGWLVWIRRRELAALQPHAWWPGLAIVAAGGFGWLVGDAAGVAFARQFGLVMMVQGAVVTLLGANVARGLMFPLCYALFLVPFGEMLEPPLQRVTVAITLPLLHLAGVPAVVDGVLIHAGRYYFEVAEACSGAKFVIAMLAYGVLVANLCFTAWRRRAMFLMVCIIVPVIANGVRAFGTIYAANLTSVERATGFDHIVYGWLFFGAVMAVVMAIGWRWFDRAPDDPAFDPAALSHAFGHRLALVPAAALVLATAGLFAGWSAAIAARAAPLPGRITLPQVPGWQRAPLSVAAPWQPYYPAADHYLFGRYANGAGEVVDMAVAVFASQREGHKLAAFGTGPLRENDVWVRVSDEPAVAGGSTMRITAPGPVERMVASWYRAGGMVTGEETVVKFATLKARMLGGDQAAVAIHLSAEGPNARAAIERFRSALGPIDGVADRVTAPR